jgi:MFS family permease
MKKDSNRRVKIGIYLCAILMMGAIAVASNVASIVAAFPEAGQTKVVAYLISAPCLVVILVTLVSGKLMNSIPKKTLMIAGVIFWLIGGTLPYFMNSLGMILIMRLVFGVGVGIIQSLCPALVVDNFTDPAERAKVMGNMTSFQMLGALFFSLVSGYLGKIGWNIAFLVHLVAIVSLIAALVCIPYKQTVKTETPSEKMKFRPTAMMWVWCVAFLIYMSGAQAYANFASSLITERGLGDTVTAGYSLACFALGGFVMGFVFGKVSDICKKLTLTVGCVLLSVSFLIMVYAPNLSMSYLGAFMCGLAFSICMPCILNGAGGAVSQPSSGMAVSIATCMQNAGMTICPYLVTAGGAIFTSSGSLTETQGVMLFSIIIILILAVVFTVIAFAGNKKTAQENL